MWQMLQPKNLEILARNFAATFPLVCSHPGCFRRYSYHELPLHELACPHGACSCTEPGCNYTGPPAELVVHLADGHLIEVIRISYGQAQLLQEQVPFTDSARRLLIFQGGRLCFRPDHHRRCSGNQSRAHRRGCRMRQVGLVRLARIHSAHVGERPAAIVG